ncbi:MAG: alpha/beta hydrolase [Hyphomicrobiaceae bacterium]
MRRLLGVLLVLLGAFSNARAESMLARESVNSPVLGRMFPFVIYLPDGYENGDLSYPVLYLLHGAGGDEAAWAKEGGIKATADRMISNRQIPPSIIVMPGCSGCWWVDGARDKAETAFWSELVPTIERRYRTIEGREGRLIAGLSAGGFGAVRFAMRYPDRIAAAAALSPAVYADVPPDISSARVQPPFLRQDGSFDDALWRDRNYPSLIDAYFRQKQRVPFYLVSGDNDRYGIAFETMTLFKRLFDHQPEASELRIVDGDHTWTIWSKSIENAMRYIYRFASPPKPMLVARASPGSSVRPPPSTNASQVAARLPDPR